jgi:regulator of sigma E protease
LLEKVFIFIIFLFPLVFFHELGHFLFARFFGVRVEVFSLGFGPKLFKFKKGDTEYCFSLIPLGGYVKMFGDDPLKKDQIPEEERRYSFTFKGKWARFWIVFGGPLANFIFTFFIFYFLLLAGEKVPEVKVGAIPNKNILREIGLKTGDVIQGINGKLIYNLADIPMGTKSKITALEVSRFGKKTNLKLDITREKFFKELIKVDPILRKPILKSASGESYKILKYNGKFVGGLSLDEIIEISPKTISLQKTDGSEKVIEVNDNKVGLILFLSKIDLYPMDVFVKSVNMDSPADKAGIKGGDVLLEIDKTKLNSFFTLRDHLNGTEKSSFNIRVKRGSETLSFSLEPEVKEERGKKTKLIGVYSGGEWNPPKYVETNSKGVFGSFPIAYDRTIDAIVKTFIGFKKLITSEVSVKNIGGPLSIGKVAADSFKTSLSYFFQIMALISVNLGVINLFPIPVLDGGHIVFILMEIVNRGPLSRRKMEIAQQFGLSLLLLLTVAALYNDFSRLF